MNRILLACLLLFAVFLGTTQIGQLSTTFRALAAATGAVLIVLYLRNLPRANDPTDRLVLGGLLLFLLTCITSSAGRASFEAATTAMAYAAAYYLARGVLADERNRRMAITLLGLIGVVIGIIYLGLWGSIWLRWIAVLGAGAPPFNLRLPALLYHQQYVVGMLAIMLLPATIELARRRMVWPLGVVGTVSCVLIALMSGGRTVWLAAIAAGILAVLGTRGVRRSLTRRNVTVALALGLVGIVGLAVAGGPFLARLGNTDTIELRLGIWGTALSHWLDSLRSVAVGYGPGSFARELGATGYYSSFSSDVPHGHNAIVQALFEGGLLGLAAMSLVCAGVIVGILRTGKTYWSAAAALAFVAFASLTDNPTVFPFLIVVLIVWAAMASPRNTAEAVEPHRYLQVASMAMAVVLAAAVASTFVAAWSYDQATRAAAAGDSSAVVASLRRAAGFDPSFPLYHRDLGVWLAGDNPAEAAEKLRTAIDLNPADTQAVRALALLYADEGNREAALNLSARLVTDYGTRIESALTAAYVHASFQDDEEEHSALVSAVRRVPWIMAAPEWKQVFPQADPTELIRDAHAQWQDPAEFASDNLMARVWLAALLGSSPPDGTPSGLELQSTVLRCRMQVAQHLADQMTGAGGTDIDSIVGLVMLENTRLVPALDNHLSFQFQVREPGLARLVLNSVESSLVPDAFQDITFYERVPLAPRSIVALPTAPSGLSSWLRDPMAAARAAAPDSDLAGCGEQPE